ncbi:MAG: ATP-binding protein [Deltaproteobacteria bacterium]|jgi:hypothetical protein|nr:ATP-binding protein [Deltaproteobacteria bacterium]
MKKLPDGIASFPKIIQNDFIYVDKTRHLYELLNQGNSFFLSRPRRFGKTLLLSTLKAILEGRRQLFKGLWIDQPDYTWDVYPVIHLSLASLTTDSVELFSTALNTLIEGVARKAGIEPHGEGIPSSTFMSLINDLNIKHDKEIAVLIDEYYTPILNAINNPEKAVKIRDALKLFYAVLKDVEEIRGFTFITGVGKFPQTSIFSSLNNLVDLTRDENFAEICGITVDELDTVFPEFMKNTLEHLKSEKFYPPEATVSDIRKTILEWYDGYSWDGRTRILNPWSLLKTFYKNRFGDYWTQSGGIPIFLQNLIQSGIVNFSSFKAEDCITDSLNVVELGKELKPIPILFQAGYLTVEKINSSSGLNEYYLDIPNLEVKAGIIPLLLSLDPIKSPLIAKRQCESMLKAINNRDAFGVQNHFGSYLAFFPYNIHNANESYYHSLFISAMLFAGASPMPEVSVGNGRYDLGYKADDVGYFVFEIKYCSIETNNEGNLSERMECAVYKAMKQIKVKNYTKHMLGQNYPIYKVALVVGGRSKVLALFEQENDNYFF